MKLLHIFERQCVKVESGLHTSKSFLHPYSWTHDALEQGNGCITPDSHALLHTTRSMSRSHRAALISSQTLVHLARSGPRSSMTSLLAFTSAGMVTAGFCRKSGLTSFSAAVFGQR